MYLTTISPNQIDILNKYADDLDVSFVKRSSQLSQENKSRLGKL